MKIKNGYLRKPDVNHMLMLLIFGEELIKTERLNPLFLFYKNIFTNQKHML